MTARPSFETIANQIPAGYSDTASKPTVVLQPIFSNLFYDQSMDLTRLASLQSLE